MTDKIVTVMFNCGHEDQMPKSMIRDLVSKEYCASCIELFELENEKKQMRLDL